ncbi:MAG: hypothetical protein H6709_24835, partial [Kofleriaceae bacterium]|nr:hypothetical protein [Kofleriaceae bacterium]
YHGWTFDLDGRLRRAPGADADAATLADVALAPVEVAAWGPLVFAAIAPRLTLDDQLAGITPPAASLRWVMRRDYELACNWKVYVDNYLEGYHIPIVHPELHEELDPDGYRTEVARWSSRQHAPLRATDGDGSDGRRYRPDDQPDGADAEYHWVFPNLMLNAYQGQLQTNVVVPLAPDRTRVTFEWFAEVAPAEPLVDERWRRLVDFSDLLQVQDTTICEQVHRNLGSRGARRGRYVPRHEAGVHHFHRLLAELLAPALVAAACLLAACGGGGGGDDAAATPDAMPTRVFGGDRPVELEVPAGYDPSQQYPLVLVLHGYSANGLLQEAYMQLAELSTSGTAFVLAPDGLVDSDGNHCWNASPACCDFDHRGVDDVAYLGGLIDDVMASWSIDPARVYVIGHSNGAYMAYRMACDRADVITAIAGLAGLMISVDGSGCNPARPVSILHLHGDADDTVPYDGDGGPGGAGASPGAVASTAIWAALDGCGTTTTAGAPLDLVRDIDGAETQVASYDDCPSGLGVELWTLTGAGHIPNWQPDFDETVWAWLTSH